MDDSQFEWLVKNRSDIQRLLWDLLRFVRQEDQRKRLTEQPLHCNVFGLLVGVGYSLWRAVFLMGEARKAEPHSNQQPINRILSEATTFLEFLVRDNSIGYTQESSTRLWTSRYYLNSAIYRMHRVATKFREANKELPVELVRVVSLDVDFDKMVDMPNAWAICHSAARASLDVLCSEVSSAVGRTQGDC